MQQLRSLDDLTRNGQNWVWQEASLILTSVKPELIVGGTLQTRTILAPFGCEEVKVMHGEEEDQSAGRLVVPKTPDGIIDEEQKP